MGKRFLLASNHLVGLVSLGALSSVPAVRKLAKQAADAEYERIYRLAFIQAVTGASQEAIDAEIKRKGSLEVVYLSVGYGGPSYEALKESAVKEQCPRCP